MSELDEDDRGAANSQSDGVRRRVCVASICLQALILTHECADAASWTGRIAEHLWPVPPNYIFGRSASWQPLCDGREAVWYGWRDRTGYNIFNIVFF